MNPSHLDFLFSLGNFGIKLGLDNMNRIMAELSHPEKHPSIIHCAGTNGKGSTLSTLETFLLDSGYSVGMTTSPHLINLNERIRVNGKPVSDEELESLFIQVCSACGMDPDHPEDVENWKIAATFFECVISMALLCFQQNQVDFVLLETGMGGRLDATNVVPHPLLQILTPISKDHEAFLGDTLEKIASEKLGIVKMYSPTVVSRQSPEILHQIEEYCGVRQSETNVLGRDFSLDKKGKEYRYQGKTYSVSFETLGLKGRHQLENVATALAAYEIAVPENKRLAPGSLKNSLERLKWPGRLELIPGTPDILVDGAHNEDGWKMLVEYILKHHASNRILFATNWMVDKEIPGIFHQLDFGENAFLPLENPYHRAASTEQVEAFLKAHGHSVLSPLSLNTFVANLDHAYQDYDLIVVAGSLYLIGNFYSHFKKAAI